MPRNPEISKKEKLSLREGLFGGMSKKQLEQVRNRARETQAPYSTLEHRMVDVVCLTSHTHWGSIGHLRMSVNRLFS